MSEQSPTTVVDAPPSGQDTAPTSSVASPTPSATALAIKDQPGALAGVDYGTDAGAGMQFSHLGGRVPFLSVLQALSKAVTPGDEKFIPGAQQGMFALVDQKVIFDGLKGVNFIGLAESYVFVEKTSLDANGRWVADHEPSSDIVRKAVAANGGRQAGLKTAGGNVLIGTFRMIGVIVDDFNDLTKGLVPCCIGFERSKLKARQGFMDRLGKLKNAAGGPAIPLYAAKLRISTKMEQGRKGTFYNLSVKFAVEDDVVKSLILPKDPQWKKWSEQARNVAQGVASGAIKGDAATDHGGGGAGEDDIPF